MEVSIVWISFKDLSTTVSYSTTL